MGESYSTGAITRKEAIKRRGCRVGGLNTEICVIDSKGICTVVTQDGCADVQIKEIDFVTNSQDSTAHVFVKGLPSNQRENFITGIQKLIIR